MSEIGSLREAELLVASHLNERSSTVIRVESRVKPGNSILQTNTGDLFHVKFTKKPFRPDSDKQGAARELHLKLQFAISKFQNRLTGKINPDEAGTMIGIDEDLLLNLCFRTDLGTAGYVCTVLQRGIILWIPAIEFYSFVMRYDTFMKYPRSGIPVCYVPTGYFLSWESPVPGFPTVIQ